MWACLYLGAAWWCGYRLLRRAAPVLTRGECAAGGFFVGCQLAAWLPFLASWALGFGAVAIAAAAVVLAATAMPLARKAPPPAAGSLLPLLPVLPAAALSTYLFWIHTIPVGSDGHLYSGGAGWSDLGLHLSLIASFALGDNFPPVNPFAPPYPLHYHYLSDFLSAVLVALGLDLRWAILLPSIPAYPCLLWLASGLAGRLVGPVAGTLAVALFAFNGGLGLLYLPRVARDFGHSLWQELLAPSIRYTYFANWDLHYGNFLVINFLPQRATLAGEGMALLSLLLLLCVLRASRDGATERDLRVPLMLAGCIAGLTPLFHIMSYLSLMAVGWLWIVFEVRRDRSNAGRWGYFLTPALMLGGVQVALLASGAGALRWHPGWMMDGPWYAWPWFWIKNGGVVVLLAPVAWWAADREQRRLYLPFLALFAALNLVAVHVDAANEVRYTIGWFLASAALVGQWLCRLAARGALGRAAAAGLVAAGVAAGALDSWRETRLYLPYFHRLEVEAAAWAAGNTPRRAVFLTSPDYRHPVGCLAGRTILMGYRWWLVSWGLDPTARERDIAAIYAGGPAARRLLAEYGVSYIYVGASEQEALKVNEAFLATLEPVYRGEGGKIRIFRVPPAGGT